MKILELAPLLVAPVLAAVDVAPIPDLPVGIGSLSATALLGWYMWYTTKHVLPRKDAAHRETIEKIVEKHSEDQAAEHHDHDHPNDEPR